MTDAQRRGVLRCCYLGMFVQALVINLAPLLFLPLKREFGLSFEQVGRLVLVNFITQMLVDLACSALAGRLRDVKPLLVLANLLAGIGLWVFALAPAAFANPYHGLMLGTLVFSVGCGLLEVLLSPLLDALPPAPDAADTAGRKAADMALLHAFYPIGKVAVIVVTALALYALGPDRWRPVVLVWSVFPFLNTLGFLLVRPPSLLPDGETHQGLRDLLRRPAFLVLLLSIGLAGATEVTLGQWASAYIERGLGLSKLTADLVGFCLFGVGMIAGRLWLGLRGEKADLRRAMLAGALLSAGSCVVMALSPSAAPAVAACAAAGLFVSLLWPGTLSLSSARFPRAGASMFALLAASGDAGAALMPWALGSVADRIAHAGGVSFFGADASPEQTGLRAGILLTAACPLLLALVLVLLRRLRRD